jgi:hypothetical protein
MTRRIDTSVRARRQQLSSSQLHRIITRMRIRAHCQGQRACRAELVIPAAAECADFPRGQGRSRELQVPRGLVADATTRMHSVSKQSQVHW